MNRVAANRHGVSVFVHPHLTLCFGWRLRFKFDTLHTPYVRCWNAGPLWVGVCDTRRAF